MDFRWHRSRGSSNQAVWPQQHIIDSHTGELSVPYRLCGSQMIQSAFSVRFSEFGKNVYDLFAPDFMHEFELVSGKASSSTLCAFSLHKGKVLLRLSIAGTPCFRDGYWVASNHQSSMHQMPTFGRNCIHQFWHNITTHKKLVAHDYEAFLLVSGDR